ncbi:hypothetical protein PORY_001322 [Pneumocystis oryctolagi]|uniref:Uncharacterized protein n=1 Tax=Pneumocystis oryctolagi TaxID=42067 RepID=A0ACB7CDK3_9ASCO|nr:hypothetical protein PORY_001322 [Pneumocystis oryctolagi]
MANINNNSTDDLSEYIPVSKNKAVIKSVDMSDQMKIDAIDCGMYFSQILISNLRIAIFAMEKYNVEKDIAAHFDKKFGTTWHCIVGRNFGSYVTHETKHFIYFYLGQIAILLFKSG